MAAPQAVIVHSLAQARQALAANRPVTLLSAPGAAIYAGAGWWLALVEAAAGGAPPPPNFLDCGGAAGRALEALRAGQKHIILQAPEAIFAEVSVIAASFDAAVLAVAPPSLDLGRPGAARLLAAWLAGDHTVTAPTG
jgi:succinyl-CoA synthetase beta subunit